MGMFLALSSLPLCVVCLLLRAVAVSSSSVEELLSEADEAQQKGDIKRAFSFAKRAVKLDPEDVNAQTNLALLHKESCNVLGYPCRHLTRLCRL